MKKALSAAEAKSSALPGFHYAGETLYLFVAPGGSKSWVQRLTIHGRRCDIGLGGFPVVSLAEARDKAFQNRKLARAGGDPLAEKRKAKIPTFWEAAEKTFEANRARWRSEKNRQKNWEQGMKKHVLPVLGGLRVDRIRREDVLRILTPIWTKIPEVARKQRNRIRAVLSWCQAHGFIEHNVAGEMIDGALPAMPAVKQHFRALPYRALPAALETVETSGAPLAAKLCFRFLVLTATRSGEARGRGLVGNQPGDEGMAHAGYPYEGRCRTPGAAVRCGPGRAGAGADFASPIRSGFPVGAAARQTDVGHDPHQGPAG